MQRLTDEQIKEINSQVADSWNEGVFKQPFGLDKELDYVIYQRHETGGMTGGGYQENAYCRPYTNDDGRPNWTALDLVLKTVCPDISYLKYKDIEALVSDSSDNDDHDYYGNYSSYDFYWLPLEKLYNYLNI